VEMKGVTGKQLNAKGEGATVPGKRAKEKTRNICVNMREVSTRKKKTR